MQDPEAWSTSHSSSALVRQIHADMEANGVNQRTAAGVSIDNGDTTETFLPTDAFEAAANRDESHMHSKLIQAKREEREVTEAEKEELIALGREARVTLKAQAAAVETLPLPLPTINTHDQQVKDHLLCTTSMC
jgi:histidinol dehydrogenase